MHRSRQPLRIAVIVTVALLVAVPAASAVHVPHDVASEIELSPDFAVDGTAFAIMHLLRSLALLSHTSEPYFEIHANMRRAKKPRNLTAGHPNTESPLSQTRE